MAKSSTVKTGTTAPRGRGGTGRAKAPKAARPVGRPPIEFDLDLVERLGRLHCTDEEIAHALGVARQTFADRKANDPGFLDRLEKGKAEGKQALRRLQMQQAEAGNPTMLIWLGKQLLGQRDKQDHSGTVTHNVVTADTMAEAKRRAAEFEDGLRDA